MLRVGREKTPKRLARRRRPMKRAVFTPSVPLMGGGRVRGHLVMAVRGGRMGMVVAMFHLRVRRPVDRRVYDRHIHRVPPGRDGHDDQTADQQDPIAEEERRERRGGFHRATPSS